MKDEKKMIMEAYQKVMSEDYDFESIRHNIDFAMSKELMRKMFGKCDETKCAANHSAGTIECGDGRTGYDIEPLVVVQKSPEYFDAQPGKVDIWSDTHLGKTVDVKILVKVYSYADKSREVLDYDANDFLTSEISVTDLPLDAIAADVVQDLQKMGVNCLGNVAESTDHENLEIGDSCSFVGKVIAIGSGQLSIREDNENKIVTSSQPFKQFDPKVGQRFSFDAVVKDIRNYTDGISTVYVKQASNINNMSVEEGNKMYESNALGLYDQLADLVQDVQGLSHDAMFEELGELADWLDDDMQSLVSYDDIVAKIGEDGLAKLAAEMGIEDMGVGEFMDESTMSPGDYFSGSVMTSQQVDQMKALIVEILEEAHSDGTFAGTTEDIEEAFLDFVQSEISKFYELYSEE